MPTVCGSLSFLLHHPDPGGFLCPMMSAAEFGGPHWNSPSRKQLPLPGQMGGGAGRCLDHPGCPPGKDFSPNVPTGVAEAPAGQAPGL